MLEHLMLLFSGRLGGTLRAWRFMNGVILWDDVRGARFNLADEWLLGGIFKSFTVLAGSDMEGGRWVLLSFQRYMTARQYVLFFIGVKLLVQYCTCQGSATAMYI
jgi:hypothetical protein